MLTAIVVTPLQDEPKNLDGGVNKNKAEITIISHNRNKIAPRPLNARGILFT